MSIKDILGEYPLAQSIYDTGKYYAITQGDSTILIGHDSTAAVRMLPTYSEELAEICKNAIPVWPSDLNDDSGI